jgi:hypothetical protein
MAEEKSTEKLARGIVARGRTIVVQTNERIVIGTHPETGKAVTGFKMKDAGPGEEVTLPESEIKTLRSLGFLIDPNRLAPPPAEGSHMSEST